MKRKASLNILVISASTQYRTHWIPSPKDCLKLNVDASVFNGDSSFVIGMVIKDDLEKFVLDKNMHILAVCHAPTKFSLFEYGTF